LKPGFLHKDPQKNLSFLVMSLKHNLFTDGNTMAINRLASLSAPFSTCLPTNQWEDDEDEEDIDMDDEDLDEDLDEEWDDEEFDIDEEDFELGEEGDGAEFDPYDDDEDDGDEEGFFDDEPEDSGHWVNDRNPSPVKPALCLADTLH
jgi:hypothetical protein